MSLLIKQAAKKLKKIGEANIPGDSILAHIEPEEASLLKRRGGSGEVDPITGLPHFKQDRDKENSGSRDADNDGGDDGGNDDGGRENDGPGNDDVKDAADALGGSRTPEAPEKKNIHNFKDPDSGDKGNDDAAETLFPNMAKKPAAPVNPASDVPYADAEEGMSQLTESMPPAVEAARLRARAAQQAAEDQTQWGITDGLGILSSPVLGGAKAVGKLAMQKAAGQKAYNDAMNKEGFSELGPEKGLKTEHDGGKDATSTPNLPKAPIQDESERPPAATPPAPDFDTFSAKARRKKGYMSTILSGNVSASTPQGKTLYGG